MNKKFLIFLFMLFAVCPLFASINSSALNTLGSDVTKPLTTIISVLKAIAIISLVVSVILTALRYLTSEAGRKPEILKSGIVACVVTAVLILAAFAIPSALGLSDVSITDSAVLVIESL